MGKKRAFLVRHLSYEDLVSRIKRENSLGVLRRLLFFRQVYEGVPVNRAVLVVGMSESTGFNWLGRWNRLGVESLVHRPGDGRPGKLDHVQKEEFWKLLGEKGRVDASRDFNHSAGEVRRGVYQIAGCAGY